MPRIFDNTAKELLPALRDTLQISDRADVCVNGLPVPTKELALQYTHTAAAQTMTAFRRLLLEQKANPTE